MDDLEIVRCSRCDQEVVVSDVCQEHDVCLWCDVECRLEAGSRDDDDQDDE